MDPSSIQTQIKEVTADILEIVKVLREENEKKDAIIKQQGFKIEQLLSEIMVLRCLGGGR